ncbi:MAG TPA: DUF5011 domain-containing protein [Candidatus Hydrogenedentes bacterium]|nr:DUF5011 domain-containing protein [Candidatus Hydrogenedentota bacterium]
MTAFTVDNTNPVMTISAPSTALTASGPVTYTVTYAGADVVTLAATDITLIKTPLGTASVDGVVSVSGTGSSSRNVTVSSITGDGSLSISIAADTARDNAGNLANGGSSASFNVRSQEPSVSINDPSALATSIGPVTYEIVYSNMGTPDALAASDVTVSWTGTATGMFGFSGSGSSFTVTLSSITGDGTVFISAPPETGRDPFDNPAPAEGATGATVIVDNTPPGVAISAPSVDKTGIGPVTYTVTYTGADTVSLAASDITLERTGTADGSVSVSGTGTSTRTVTVENITGDGSLSIDILAATAHDAVGHAAPAPAPSAAFQVMNSVPGVNIGAPSPSVASTGPVTYDIHYSGMKTLTLTTSNVVLGHSGTATGTLALSGSGNSFRTATLSNISGEGMLWIQLPSGMGIDYFDVPAPPSEPSAPLLVDNTPPSVSIGPPSAMKTRQGSVSYVVSYGGVDAVLLSPANVILNRTGTADAAVAVTGSGTGVTTRTVTLSNITGDGALSISLPVGSGLDSAGNPTPAAGPSEAFMVDNTPPAITVSAPEPPIANEDGIVTYTITYDGADTVTLDTSRIGLVATGNAMATAMVSGTGATQRTVSLTSISGNGTIQLTVLPGTAQDNVGNVSGTAASPVALTADNTAPTLSLRGPASVSQEWTLAYVDAGATASDNVDAASVITSRIETSNPVDVNTPGTYLVEYAVTDAAGNAAAPITRTVNITQNPTSLTVPTNTTSSAYRDFIRVTVIGGRITGTPNLTIGLDREPRFELSGDAQILDGSCYRVKPETTFVTGNSIGPVQIWFKDDNSDGYVDGTRVPVATLRMGRIDGRTQQFQWMNATLQKSGETSLVANTDVWGVFFLAGIPENAPLPTEDADGDGIPDLVEDENGDGVWSHVDAAFPMRWPFPGNETDWLNWDTDGDNISDGIEVALGTNPLDPDDPPHGAGQLGVPMATPAALALLATILLIAGVIAVRRRRAA